MLLLKPLQAGEVGKGLVTNTSGIMEQGVNDSAQAKQYMDEIVEFVGNQQWKIGSVNDTLQKIAGMVEHNAASAEENTAFSQQLSECPLNLKQMSDSFQLR